MFMTTGTGPPLGKDHPTGQMLNMGAGALSTPPKDLLRKVYGTNRRGTARIHLRPSAPWEHKT